MRSGVTSIGFLDPGEWSYSFGQSLIDLYLTDAHTSRRVIPHGKQLRNYCGSGGLVDGRNEIVRMFLDATDSEWLFMVDSDMGFAPDTIDRLIDSADKYQRPVMGGLCFALRKAEVGPLHATRYVTVPTLYDFVETDEEAGWLSVVEYPKDQVTKVAGTGAACMLIHRRALCKVREKYGDHWFDPIPHPKAAKPFSEDLSFCVRLAACDLPIHVDTSVKTSHYKGGVYLDEELYDAQRVPELLGAG